jgi:hypothetical protein
MRSPGQPVETPASDLDRLREARLGSALGGGGVSIRVCIGDQPTFSPSTEPNGHVTGFVRRWWIRPGLRSVAAAICRVDKPRPHEPPRSPSDVPAGRLQVESWYTETWPDAVVLVGHAASMPRGLPYAPGYSVVRKLSSKLDARAVFFARLRSEPHLSRANRILLPCCLPALFSARPVEHGKGRL